MRKGQVFRLKIETLGVLAPDGGDFVTLPAHSIIRINADLDGSRFIEVLWNGKKLLLFAQDVRERGIPLPTP